MRLIRVIMLALLATSCTSATNYYTPTIQSWRGASATTLFKQWGKPDQYGRTAIGNSIYVYYTTSYRRNTPATQINTGLHVNSTGNPVLTAPNTNMVWNRGNIPTVCLTSFEVAPTGKIVNIQSEGGDCYMGAYLAQQLTQQN